MRWLKLRNTKFFHLSTNINRQVKIDIISIPSKNVLTDIEAINMGSNKERFVEVKNSMLGLIPWLVKQAQNNELMNPFYFEQIHKATFSLGDRNALGPNDCYMISSKDFGTW